MLNLTENAIAAIAGITSQSGLPHSGGVRITLAKDVEEVELALVPEPEADDDVIDEDGARVFLDAGVSPLLARHVLDAEDGPEGIGFALRKAG